MAEEKIDSYPNRQGRQHKDHDDQRKRLDARRSRIYMARQKRSVQGLQGLELG